MTAPSAKRACIRYNKNLVSDRGVVVLTVNHSRAFRCVQEQRVQALNASTPLYTVLSRFIMTFLTKCGAKIDVGSVMSSVQFAPDGKLIVLGGEVGLIEVRCCA